MGAPEAPKQKEAPKPAQQIDAKPAADAEKEFLKNRKGGMSQWLTKGQSLGGGKQLR